MVWIMFMECVGRLSVFGRGFDFVVGFVVSWEGFCWAAFWRASGSATVFLSPRCLLRFSFTRFLTAMAPHFRILGWRWRARGSVCMAWP